MLDKLGITYPQYLVMLVLWEQDDQPVNDIAKRLVLNTNTVTPLLKRMEDEGLVVRTRGSKDARQVIVSLTEKGHKLEKLAAEIPFNMAQKYSCTGLDTKTAEQFAPIMDNLILNMKEKV